MIASGGQSQLFDDSAGENTVEGPTVTASSLMTVPPLERT